jgi:hypothetical protein
MISPKKTCSHIADCLIEVRPAFNDQEGLALSSALRSAFWAGGQHALELAEEEMRGHASDLDSEAGKVAFAWAIDIVRKFGETQEQYHEEDLRELRTSQSSVSTPS